MPNPQTMRQAHSLIVGASAVKSVTFSLDTSAYASGDLLADTQVVQGALRAAGGLLQTITLNDKDDQGAAMSVVILKANVSMGTENSAPSISDTNGDSVLAIIPVQTSDWVDLGGTRVANLRNLGIPLAPISGSSDIAIALINGTGTPTYTAAGITGLLGILQD